MRFGNLVDRFRAFRPPNDAKREPFDRAAAIAGLRDDVSRLQNEIADRARSAGGIGGPDPAMRDIEGALDRAQSALARYQARV